MADKLAIMQHAEAAHLISQTIIPYYIERTAVTKLPGRRHTHKPHTSVPAVLAVLPG